MLLVKMAKFNEKKGNEMTISDIANLITIRSFLYGSIDNLNIKLSREEVKSVQEKVKHLDRLIIDHSMKLDPSKFVGKHSEMIEHSFESTEDTKVVLEKLFDENKTNK